MGKKKLTKAQEAALTLFEQNLDYFKVLGNDLRQNIVIYLWQHLDRGYYLSDIAQAMNTSETNIKYHIQTLEKSHLLYTIRNGHYKKYYLDLTEMIEHLDELVSAISHSYPESMAAKVSHKLAKS